MARKPKKYSPEIKMKAIEDYQAGKGSLRRICKKYGIKDHKTLREWISCYNGQKIFRKRSGARGEIYMTKGRKTTQEERTQIVAFCIEHSSTFGVTLIAMTMITTIVILAVTSNVVLSLGMVGALSIVRFRTAIKEPLDIAFLFWSIGVGIVLAAGMIPLAVFGSMVVGMTLLVFVNKKSYTHPYILVLNCD